jgi:RNA polymerase sigma factor (sigma-70 family)
LRKFVTFSMRRPLAYQNMTTVIESAPEDSSVVGDCLRGNRDAFEILVRRYQSLICAVIYSRCGNFAQSEDLAQETFLAAWKSLASLRDAAQFKEWLCQIARNVSANVARADSRKAHGHSSSMDLMPDLAADQPSPAAETMSREDEGVVWRALEQLPETYRLPLILFHREGESVAEVASALDLSEDVVRQRLARGREKLRQEVSSVVDGVLGRTKPGTKFTVGVLAVVGTAGGSTAKAASLGVAMNTVFAAKVVAGGSNLIGLGVLPLVGDLFIWLVFRSKARTPEERSILRRQVIIMVLTDVLFTVWMFGVIHFAHRGWIWVAGSAVGYFALRWLQLFRAFRKAGWLGEAVKSSDGRSYRKGYAPGWQIRCPKCGLTVDAGAAGLIRILAAGDTRRLGPCSRCKKLRWLIVERVKPG